MSKSYGLSSEQQKAWAEEIERLLGHTTQVEIAKELTKKCKGSEGSWKSLLSDFFQGKEKGLRLVFDYPKRAEVIAQKLGRKARDLEILLDQALGAPQSDDPAEMRVAGFEDLGPYPILDAFFPPVLGQAQGYLPPAAGGIQSSAGGKLDLSKIAATVKVSRGPHSLAVIIAAPPGLGRRFALRALVELLAREDDCPIWWGTAKLAPGSIVACEDLDQLEGEARGQLLHEVAVQNAILLTSTSPDDNLQDLPRFRSCYVPRSGDLQWSIDFLEHLAAVVEPRWGRPIHLEPLVQWLQDDPELASRAGRADLLGLLARHVAEGGSVPVPLLSILDLALRRAVIQLRRKGRKPEAQLLESCGAALCCELGKLGCMSGRWGFTVAELESAVARSLEKVLASPPIFEAMRQCGASGFFQVVEAVLDSGLFSRSGAVVRAALPQILLAGAAISLVQRGTVDKELLSAALLDSSWSDAIVGAAQRANDCAPILREILESPTALICQSLPSLVRLLSAEIPCSDASLLARAFRFCIAWAARIPLGAVTMTLTLSPSPAPAREAAVQGRIGHVPLLILLAKASRFHRADLSLAPSVADLIEGVGLPPVVRQYLELVGRWDLDEARAADALALATPWQTEGFANSEFWRRLGSDDEKERPCTLSQDDVVTWWRTAATPRLREMGAAGEAILAGTADGYSIRVALRQPAWGAQVWREALRSRIEAGAPGAVRAWADAVLFTLEWGGRVNERTLQELWESFSRPKVRALLREGLLPGLLETSQSSGGQERDFLGWLVAQLDDEGRAQLWEHWSSQGAGVPWKAFLNAGFDPARIASWAMQAKAVEGPSARPGSTAGVRDEHPGSAGAAAIQRLIELGDAEALIEILLGQPDLSIWSKALRRLAQAGDDRARAARLRLAARVTPGDRRLVLRGMRPRPEETELWQALLDQLAPDANNPAVWLHERMLCILNLLSLPKAGLGPDDLTPLLDLLDLLLQPDIPLGQVARELGLKGKAGKAWKDLLPTLRAQAHDLTLAFLGTLGEVVLNACKTGEAWPAPVISAVKGRSAIRCVIGTEPEEAWYSVLQGVIPVEGLIPFWAAVHHVSGGDGVRALLLQRAQDTPEGLKAVGGQLGLLVHAGLIELVLALVHDPVLRVPAARTVAAHLSSQRPDLLEKALDGQMLGAPEDVPDPGTATLVWKLAQIDPERAVRWLDQEFKAASTTQGLQKAWWELLVRTSRPGRGLALALERWGLLVFGPDIPHPPTPSYPIERLTR